MIERKKIFLYPNSKRVILRPLEHPEENIHYKIIARIFSLSENEVQRNIEILNAKFEKRHKHFKKFLLDRFDDHSPYLFMDSQLSEERKLLIGAYFSQEYSFESAALFNPSIVPFAKDEQSGDSHKYVMSLRATGEGHISSVTFREVYIDGNNNIEVKEASPYASLPHYIDTKTYDKETWTKKLFEQDLLTVFSEEIIKFLPDQFTIKDLQKTIRYIKKRNHNLDGSMQKVINGMIMTALSNYDIEFDREYSLSERIIFPNSPFEINGIEDARFTKFNDDNGEENYYATYTAYDGSFVVPQMIETNDFKHFKVSTLSGDAVQNKGFALFPKKIDNKYVMLSRQDKENLFIMYSDQLYFWHEKKILIRPHHSWEFSKVGNCGSPIETEEGWIVLIHGVGPLKQYSIGAILLDIEDPGKVIGRLNEPLITPNEEERNGYVPNVVYTCGGTIHNDQLIIPYAFSDMATTFATVDLKKLLKKMKK